MIILDGKKYRDELLENYKNTIKEKKLKIRLDIILIGNDEASLIYVKNKIKSVEKVGAEATLHHFEGSVKEEQIIKLIDKLNDDPETTGIILQSPTPGLNFNKLSQRIKASKDVDGLAPENIINLYHNKKCILPCTVKGIIKILERYNIEIQGKNITVIGKSDIVGKPLSLLLSNKGATVTSCDIFTKNLKIHTKNADMIISAVGKKNLITKDMVKDNFIGIDVGISRDNGKIYGDFDYANISPLAYAITPVPGGIGPMTIAMIIENLIEMSEKRG